MKSCKKCGRLLYDDATLCSACWTPADILRRGPYIAGGVPASQPTRPEEEDPADGEDDGGGSEPVWQMPYTASPENAAQPHLGPAGSGDNNSGELSWRSPRAVRPENAAQPHLGPAGSGDNNSGELFWRAVPIPENRSSFRWFFENIPGFILLGLIFIFALVVGASPHFFGGANLRNILESFCVLVPYAAGVAITARASGPDLSLGSVALYGAMLMAAGAPFPVALVAGAVAGFVNGVLVWLFKLPALMVTLVTGQILMGAVYFATRLQAVSLEGGRQMTSGIFFAVGLFTLAAGFLYVFLTPAGTPFHRRAVGGRSLTFLFAYPIAGVLAAFGGVLAVMKTGAFAPASYVAYGGTLVDLLFIWAAIASSRLLDNRVAPVLYAALAALVLALLDNAMAFAGFDAVLQGYLKAVLCLLMLFCVGLARWPFGRGTPTLYSPGG